MWNISGPLGRVEIRAELPAVYCKRRGRSKDSAQDQNKVWKSTRVATAAVLKRGLDLPAASALISFTAKGPRSLRGLCELQEDKGAHCPGLCRPAHHHLSITLTD